MLKDCILTEIVQPVCSCLQHVDLAKCTSETVQVIPVCYLPASTAILLSQTDSLHNSHDKTTADANRSNVSSTYYTLLYF